MWLATKLGFYSIVQNQPPDDGDAAIYHVEAQAREDLENLLFATALQNEIIESPEADYRYRIIASPPEIFEILSVLAESVDYDNFPEALANNPEQQQKLETYQRFWKSRLPMSGS